MSHRMQVTLSDEQYRALKHESERTGASLAELVRRAVTGVYGQRRRRTSSKGVDESFGAWADRNFDGAEYVEGLRGGLGRRLRD